MLRLTLDALEVLDAIARRGSFAAAAKELHRTTSTLSYTVKKLEDDLGVSAFDRSGHRAVLTEAGRLLLEQGRTVLDAARAMERHLRTIGAGWEAELAIAVNDVVPIKFLVGPRSNAVVPQCQLKENPTGFRAFCAETRNSSPPRRSPISNRRLSRKIWRPTCQRCLAQA